MSGEDENNNPNAKPKRRLSGANDHRKISIEDDVGLLAMSGYEAFKEGGRSPTSTSKGSRKRQISDDDDDDEEEVEEEDEEGDDDGDDDGDDPEEDGDDDDEEEDEMVKTNKEVNNNDLDGMFGVSDQEDDVDVGPKRKSNRARKQASTKTKSIGQKRKKSTKKSDEKAVEVEENLIHAGSLVIGSMNLEEMSEGNRSFISDAIQKIKNLSFHAREQKEAISDLKAVLKEFPVGTLLESFVSRILIPQLFWNSLSFFFFILLFITRI